MKTIRIFVAYTGLVLLSSAPFSVLSAQDAVPEPTPKIPLIPRAPEMSAWIIIYRYRPTDAGTKTDAGSNVKPPEQIVSVQVQKTGKTYHRVTTWSSGAQADAWTVGQRQLIKDKTSSSYVLTPADGPAADDYSKSDFEDLAWITMKQYAGYKKGAQPAFVFQAKNTERPMTRRDKYNLILLNATPIAPANLGMSQASPAASPAKSDAKTMFEQAYGDTKATVVLDAQTQLPLAYDDGRTTWAYQFTAAPTDALAPPPEVAKIIQQYADYVKGATYHPPTR